MHHIIIDYFCYLIIMLISKLFIYKGRPTYYDLKKASLQHPNIVGM